MGTYADSTIKYADPLYSYIGGLMSDRYWLGTTSSDPQNTANWSTVSGGTGGASVPVSGDNVFFDGNGNNACTMTSDMASANVTFLSGYTAQFDSSTYNWTLDSAGIWSDSAAHTFKMGTSSGNGITALGGFLLNNNSIVMDGQTGSKITVGTNFRIATNITMTNGGRFSFTFASSVLIERPGLATNFNSLTYNDGITISVPVTSATNFISSYNDLNVVLGNCTLAISDVNGCTAVIGASTACTIAANFAITGSNKCIFEHYFSTANITNNCTTAHTFQGKTRLRRTGIANAYVTPFNMPNASWYSEGANGFPLNKYFLSGTHRFKSVYWDNPTVYVTVWTMSTYNPSFEIVDGDYIFNNNPTSEMTYNRGTGSIKILSSGTRSFNADGKSLEKLIIQASGTINMSADAIVNGFLLSSGTFCINGYTLTSNEDFILTSGIFCNNGLIKIYKNFNIFSSASYQSSGQIKLFGSEYNFNLNYSNRSFNDISVESGAVYHFINGVITCDNLNVSGAAYFSINDDFTIISNISGDGTLSSETGDTKYIYYTTSNTFTGTLDNVILVEYSNLIQSRTYINDTTVEV